MSSGLGWQPRYQLPEGVLCRLLLVVTGHMQTLCMVPTCEGMSTSQGHAARNLALAMSTVGVVVRAEPVVHNGQCLQVFLISPD